MEEIVVIEGPALTRIPIPVLTRHLPTAHPYPDLEAIRSAAAAFWATPSGRRLLPDSSVLHAYQAQRAYEFTY